MSLPDLMDSSADALPPQSPRAGWRAFWILLGGQAVSLLGTGMTRFALLVWAYEEAGTATALALIGFSSTIAYVIASPFAGVLVDRWDRRRVMVLSDLGAGLMTAAMLALFLTGELRVWHIYLAEAVTGALGAFQEPAFGAATSVLLPREAYTRANALLGLGRSASHILAPALAGVMLPLTGLGGVMVVDLSTMALAIFGLLFVRVPAPPESAEGRAIAPDFGHQLLFGARYIWRHAGLLWMALTFFLVNLFGTLTYFAVYSPMILARTGGDEVALGIVRSVMGVGGIVGGIGVGLWAGGSRRKLTKAQMYGLSTLLSFLVADFLNAISRSTAGWAIAGFLAELTIPFIVSPYFALWQEIVPPDVQGRVFSTREMLQVLSQPIGFLAGGLLADHVFEPALQTGGALAGSLGWLVGTGAGSGMSAMFVFTSILGALTGLLALVHPAIRRLEAQRAL